MISSKVSVLIPAFNVAHCIGDAISSALNQTLPPYEIIVVDDCSSDNTVEVVERIARDAPVVKVVCKPVNGGVGAARNTGIEAATGDWIAILDADDRYQPERLNYLVTAAEERNLDLAADNFYNFDFHAGKIVGIAIPAAMIGKCLELDRYSFVRHCMTSLAGAVDFGLLKPIFRRRFLQETGVRYRSDIRHGEDFILYLSLLVRGAKFGVFPDAYYVYTQRFGSLSRKHSSLTRTTVDYSAVEMESRNLAESDLTHNDPKLAELLILRANKTKAARKFLKFRLALHEKRLVQAASEVLLDREVRQCAVAAVQHKVRKQWGSMLRASL